MAKQNYIEFQSQLLTDGISGRTLECKSLVTPVEALTTNIQSLIIDGSEVLNKSNELSTFVKAIKRTNELEAKGQNVDCVGFTALVCGGVQLEMPVSARKEQRPWAEVVFGTALPIEEWDEAATLTPFLLGKPDSRGVLDPVHAHARLLAHQDLWAEKIGLYPIVLAQFADIASFYSSSHAARAYIMSRSVGERPVISYRDGELPAGLNRLTNRPLKEAKHK